MWAIFRLSDLGLETFDTATLFAKLLTPTSFLIVIIIQVHYFQNSFLGLSDLARFRYDTSPFNICNALCEYPCAIFSNKYSHETFYLYVYIPMYIYIDMPISLYINWIQSVATIFA